MMRVSGWIVRWTITLRLILINATGGIQSALYVFADVTSTSLITISTASRFADALETVSAFSAFRVRATWPSQAFVAT